MLRGKKVVLRDKQWEDATNDYAWRSDDELARLDAAPPLRVPYTEYLFEHATEINATSERRRRYAIETLDGRHIGNCMYYDVDKKRGQAELGIMIGDRDYWQQGYGADAVTVLLDHIFTTTNITRVYLKTLDWNARAQGCFRKCGFVAYGHITRRDKTFVTMQITRKDWERRKLASPVTNAPTS